MRLKAKTIKSGGNSFIKRLSIYFHNYSIKVHLILDDDKDEPHTHPWDFKSLLLVPYKEVIFSSVDITDNKLITTLKHNPLTIVKRLHNERHRVRLYRIFRLKIPALTIGIYSKKIQLCSFCKDLGYCKESKKPIK